MSLADAFERRTAEGAVDDLTLLDEITGEGIAETLTKRNSSEDMYTSIGPVLIAVNPYQQLQKAGDSIYATQVARHYYNHEAHELAPHLFGVAASAFKALTRRSKDQCIIVTGESGAGKTEAAKQVMSFITTVTTDDQISLVGTKGKPPPPPGTPPPPPPGAPPPPPPPPGVQPPPSTTTLTSKERAERALAKTHNTSKVNKKLAARAGKKKHATAGNPIAAIDESTKEVFAELAEGGDSVSLDAIFSIPDFETALDDGLFDGDFLKALYDALASAPDKGLDLAAFSRYLAACEAEMALAADAGCDGVVLRASIYDQGLEESFRRSSLTFAVGNDMARVDVDTVKRALLESNPVLEAFGNARTVRNDNSSRFGKFMQMLFDYNGAVCGGRIASYLLEKSRVVAQSPGERNFHIFHGLVASAKQPEREQWRVHASCEDYSYLMNETRTIPGVSDEKVFAELRAALGVVGINESVSAKLMRVVSLVLALGQLRFEEGVIAEGSAGGAAAASSDEGALRACGALLQVSDRALEFALTRHQLAKGGGRSSVTMRNLNVAEARSNCDTLAKEIYKRLFDFLVMSVNKTIDYHGDHLTLGLLDVYGFEVFEHNDFEQFMINFLNEKLQQHFIELTLRTEQEEYEAEGIAWQHVEYFNNAIVCELIEIAPARGSGGTSGVLTLLDEQCAFKEATSQQLLAKLDSGLGQHAHFLPSVKLRRDDGFGVKHYAGTVTYEVAHFIDKNRDTLFADLISLVLASSDDFVCSLFRDKQSASVADKAKRPPSVSQQYKKQVGSLMDALRACEPHYCRCIKPNDEKKPGVVQPDRIAHQVQYLGLVENVRVRRAGFCYRATFSEFLRRYALLSAVTWPSGIRFGEGEASTAVRALLVDARPCEWPHLPEPLPTIELSDDDFELGHTKVFVKNPKTLFMLERARAIALHALVARMQRAWRRALGVQRFIRMKDAALKLQSCARGVPEAIKYRRLRSRVLRFEGLVRGARDRKLVAAMRRQYRDQAPREWALRLQRKYRAHRAVAALDVAIRDRCNAAGVRIAEARARLRASTLWQAAWRKHVERIKYRAVRSKAVRLEALARRFCAMRRAARAADFEFSSTLTRLHAGLELKKFSHSSGLGGKKVVSKVLNISFVEPGANDPSTDERPSCTILSWTGGLWSKGRRGVPLNTVTALHRGPRTEFLREAIGADEQAAQRCFSIEYGTSEFAVELATPQECAILVRGLVLALHSRDITPVYDGGAGPILALRARWSRAMRPRD